MLLLVFCHLAFIPACLSSLFSLVDMIPEQPYFLLRVSLIYFFQHFILKVILTKMIKSKMPVITGIYSAI